MLVLFALRYLLTKHSSFVTHRNNDHVNSSRLRMVQAKKFRKVNSPRPPCDDSIIQRTPGTDASAPCSGKRASEDEDEADNENESGNESDATTATGHVSEVSVECCFTVIMNAALR